MSNPEPRWQPPTLDEPTTYTLPRGKARIVLEPDQDAILLWPDQPRTATLEVLGGRNVVMDGGIATGEGIVRMRRLTGVVWLHNIELALDTKDPKDGLNIGGPEPGPIIVLQDMRITGIWGASPVHGDCFMLQSPVRELHIDGMTCRSGYQCLFFGGHLLTGPLEIHRADLRCEGPEAGYALWLPDDVPVDMHEVYAYSEGHKASPSVWPRVGREPDERNCASYPANDLVVGEVQGPHPEIEHPEFVPTRLSA